MDVTQFAASSDNVAEHYRQTQRKEPAKALKVDLPRHQRGERFIKGPIPFEWMRVAASCGKSGGLVGVLLWYRAGLQRSNPVKLTASNLEAFGIHTKTARRSLKKMADAGLVDVEFNRGRSPLVTIRDHRIK